MRKTLHTTLTTTLTTLALLAVIITACAPVPTVPREITIPAPENGLAYFGFALIDCGWDDTGDEEVKTNYLDEVAGFTNAAQMCVYSPDEDLAQRLDAFRQAGVKAILYVEPILFEQTESAQSPSGRLVFPAEDAEARWSAFVEKNREALTSATIAAIYVVDEPAWNGVTEADLSRAVEIIESSLPEIPTMLVEGWPAVDELRVPPALDWVGFDRYGVIDPATDEQWLADLETVRAARTRADQKIVIIADTQWLPLYGSAGVKPEDMAWIISRYYQLAATDPDVIALLGYTWPAGLDGVEQLGARSLPSNALDLFKEIGALIIR
jgi:hypothetical protein